MAITKEPPRRIFLGGDMTLVNEFKASEAITPGHLIQLASGAYQKQTPAAVAASPTFALDAPEINKGYDDDYAANDLVWAGVGHKGSKFWAWLASGETVAIGTKLESAAAGQLAALASGVPLATALEVLDTSGGAARIRVEVL